MTPGSGVMDGFDADKGNENESKGDMGGGAMASMMPRTVLSGKEEKERLGRPRYRMLGRATML